MAAVYCVYVRGREYPAGLSGLGHAVLQAWATWVEVRDRALIYVCVLLWFYRP